MNKDLSKNKNLRKKVLIDTLNEYKLEYKPYGNHYSYIHYNKPTLDVIIQEDILEQNIKHSRTLFLAKQLQKINLNLDVTLPSCYKYINNIGIIEDLEVLIKNIDLEYFFKYNTQYRELLKKHDQVTAREIALKEYLSKTTLNKNIKDIKLCFD
jgi:hypothetical protein